MKKNVGKIDRILRTILGVALIAFAVLDVQPIGMFGWIGVVPLLTAFVSFCPVYTALGLHTCESNNKDCC